MVLKKFRLVSGVLPQVSRGIGVDSRPRPSQRDSGCLDPAFDLELVEYVRQMPFDSPNAEDKGIRDLSIAHALLEKVKDLTLAAGEASDLERFAARAALESSFS